MNRWAIRSALSLLFLFLMLFAACTTGKKETPKGIEPILWQGIPLINGALIERETDRDCIYTVRVSTDRVAQFYHIAMAKKGFKNTTRRRSQVSAVGGGPMVSLNFTRNTERVHISIIHHLKRGFTQVMLHRF